MVGVLVAAGGGERVNFIRKTLGTALRFLEAISIPLLLVMYLASVAYNDSACREMEANGTGTCKTPRGQP